MAEITWEKRAGQQEKLKTGKHTKFLIAGLIALGSVFYLIVSGTTTNARYFITVDELVSNSAHMGESVRITGAVLGDTIQYDTSTLTLDFTIAHIPAETEDLAKDLYMAVNNESVTRIAVHMENEVKPDLLRHEAQAILTGAMGDDGIFYATELLLKCPSRYEESLPDQTVLHDAGA